jgi:hypothetical protein
VGWIALGFRNFLLSIYDFILHYSIRTYLCRRQGETYHITDISKGAMLVRDAQDDREARWDRWYPSLRAEIKLTKKPHARTIAIGRRIEDYLQIRGTSVDRRICHFSTQAVGCWKRAIRGRETEYESFAAALVAAKTMDEILHSARTAMTEARMDNLVNRVLSGLPLSLSEREKWLLFCYKKEFESLTSSS